MEIYTHLPLQHHDSIRLLELLPGPKDSPLSCRLSVARKDDHLEYEALSYAWGDPVFSESIKEASSGAAIRITHNLYEALQFLRHEDSPRIFWIDAICINQNDLAEKGHQVALMGHIFRDASRVVVWLGARDCSKTVEILRVLAYEFPAYESTDYLYLSKVTGLLVRLYARRFFEQAWYVKVIYTTRSRGGSLSTITLLSMPFCS